MVIEAECRAVGLDEATIESMRLKGFFAPISARSAARADIRDAIEEIDAEMIGMLEELPEVCGRIAAAKARRAELVAMFKGLRP